MKKIICVLLSAVLMLALCACGESSQHYVVGVCLNNSSEFMTNYATALTGSFVSLSGSGREYEPLVADAQDSWNTQIQQVEAFIEQGVDALIVCPVQPDRAAEITARTDAAGMPVVYISREPAENNMAKSDNICYVGSEISQSGTLQGQIITELVTLGDINRDGALNYAMIYGDSALEQTQVCREYSVAALEDAGLEPVCVYEGECPSGSEQQGYDTAVQAFAAGSAIDVIFCSSDELAAGAQQAISEAGRTVGTNIYLVGCGGTADGCEMVRSGLMTGTVQDDYSVQARKAAEAAVRYIHGEQNDKYYMVDYKMITL